jgi:hypothetical protein
VSYCCIYWQKKVLHNHSLNFCISMWKSLYQTFITYTTVCFLGLYSWMSSSRKWWYQSSKYGNDWHIINMFMCIFNQNIQYVLEKFKK